MNYSSLKKSMELIIGKENFVKYKQILCAYYQGKISHGQMEQKVLELLGENVLHHNQFFNSLNFECLQESSSNNFKRQLQLNTYFENEDFLKSAMIFPDIRKNFIPDPKEQRDVSVCVYNGYFPDVEMLGKYVQRYILSKPEYKFFGATKDCIKYLTLSIRVLIKGILMKIFASRGEYRQRGNFLYAFGSGNEHTLSDDFDKSENLCDDDIATSLSTAGEIMPKFQSSNDYNKAQAANELACRDKSSFYKHPISLVELHDVLLNHPELLPFSSVHTQILDKCLAALTNLDESDFE